MKRGRGKNIYSQKHQGKGEMIVLDGGRTKKVQQNPLTHKFAARSVGIWVPAGRNLKGGGRRGFLFLEGLPTVVEPF